MYYIELKLKIIKLHTFINIGLGAKKSKIIQQRGLNLLSYFTEFNVLVRYTCISYQHCLKINVIWLDKWEYYMSEYTKACSQNSSICLDFCGFILSAREAPANIWNIDTTWLIRKFLGNPRSLLLRYVSLVNVVLFSGSSINSQNLPSSPPPYSSVVKQPPPSYDYVIQITDLAHLPSDKKEDTDSWWEEGVYNYYMWIFQCRVFNIISASHFL